MFAAIVKTEGSFINVTLDRVRGWAGAIVAVIATWFTFRHLFVSHAAFTGDDWHYFALLRHLDSPLDVFSLNIGGAYFYRPVALLFFWLSEAIFGINAAAHYGINIALHGWVAFEVAAFAAMLTRQREMSGWVATLFLVLPATAATPLWISDRFDLIATAAMLGSVRLMAQWTQSSAASRGNRWGSVALALIAFGSKETAFALVPAVLLLLTWGSPRPLRTRFMTGGVILVITALALCSRLLVLGGLNGGAGSAVAASALLDGTWLWFVRLPVAVQTHGGLLALGTLAVGTVALAAARLLAREPFTVEPAATPSRLLLPVAALLLLMVGVVIAQAPIALTALAGHVDALPTVSLRFYYAPLAASFILIAAAAAPLARDLKPVWLWLMRGAATVAVMMCAYGSAAQSRMWAANTATQARQAASLLADYSVAALRAQNERPCLVRLPMVNAALTDIDLRFKAGLGRSDPRLNCALLTSPPQTQTITRLADCGRDGLAPAHSTVPELSPLRRAGTCTHFFLGE